MQDWPSTLLETGFHQREIRPLNFASDRNHCKHFESSQLVTNNEDWKQMSMLNIHRTWGESRQQSCPSWGFKEKRRSPVPKEDFTRDWQYYGPEMGVDSKAVPHRALWWWGVPLHMLHMTPGPHLNSKITLNVVKKTKTEFLLYGQIDNLRIWPW